MDSEKIFPNRRILLAFFAIILFTLAFRIGSLPLKFEEPRRALVATEMMVSGNYTAPTINGEFYYNKPPLFNWMLAGLFKTLGHDEWVERLPSLLSIIGLSLLNFFFFRKKLGNEIAGLASLFFVLAGHMLFYFSFQGEIDMTFSFVVYTQILCIIHFFEKRNFTLLFFTSYLLMTIGFLMKGLPSIAFQGLTLLGIFIWNKQFLKLFLPSHFLAFIVSISVLTGYFYLYSNYNDPELLIARLTTESARRTTESGGIIALIIQLIKFPLLLLMLMLPWSLLVGGMRDLKKAYENKWIRYIIAFLVFNLPIYWISAGVRDRYLYMFLPFLLSILAFSSVHFIRNRRKMISHIVVGLVLLLILVFIVLPFLQPVSAIYSVIIVGLLVGIGYFIRTIQIHPIFGLMIIMLTLRLYYNEVVFPLRVDDPKNIEAYAPAYKIIDIIGDEELVFVSKKNVTEAQLPFREPVLIEEIERLPYQLSYYYSSKTSKILSWSDTEPNTGYFLKIGKDDGRSVYDFVMEGRAFSLIKK